MTKSRMDGLRKMTDAAGYMMTDAMLKIVGEEAEAMVGEMGTASALVSPREIILRAARRAVFRGR